MFFVDVYRQLVGLIWLYVSISSFYGYSLLKAVFQAVLFHYICTIKN